MTFGQHVGRFTRLENAGRSSRSRRWRRSSVFEAVVMFLPFQITSPEVGSTSWLMQRSSVLFARAAQANQDQNWPSGTVKKMFLSALGFRQVGPVKLANFKT